MELWVTLLTHTAAFVNGMAVGIILYKMKKKKEEK